MSNYNNQNTFFFNNNNNSNEQNQLFPHENLFNKKITDFHGFKYNCQNNYDKLKNLNNKKYNMDIDYEKQYKEQHYRQMAINQSNMRFKNIYENKIKNSQSDWSNLNENGEVFIDEYIDNIREMHKDSNNYEAFKQRNEFFNFSSCPFCKGPAFFSFERVTCINKCFMTAVCKDSFDKNYTLDNFMEQYQDYYSKHQNCDRSLLTLYVDKESKCAEFLCLKCEKEYISF
jgi:hypothetical protein